MHQRGLTRMAIFTLPVVSLEACPVAADTAAAVVGLYPCFYTLAKASLRPQRTPQS